MVTKIAHKNDSVPSAKDAGIEKTKIRISSKRQITIPSKYFEALGFDKEIECIKSNGMLILIPVKSDESYFAEEILKDLISQGYSGDKLLAEFKKMSRKIRPAVKRLIEEADKIAEITSDYYTDPTRDIFGD